MQPVDLRSRVVGAVMSDVREFDGRLVVWVDVDAGSRVGALTSDSSGKIENASQMARAKASSLGPMATGKSRRYCHCCADLNRTAAVDD